MPSPIQKRAVALTDIFRSLGATRSSLAFVLLAAGCWSSYWGRRPLDQPIAIEPDDPVLIWNSSGVEKWHAVVITQDSVSGIPYEAPLRCTLCRRSIPRVQVDSMTLYYRTLAEDVTNVVGPPTLIILAELVAGLVVSALR